MRAHQMITASAVLVLAGCGGGTGEAVDAVTSPSSPESPRPSPPASSSSAAPNSPSSSPPATPSRSPERGTKIVVGPSEFGQMLFDERGQAIYLFDNERTSEPTCYDACAVAWPPVLTEGMPVAGGAVDGGLLGTTRRRDGATQVTYQDHPLYFYVNEGPGEVRCHDIFLNGGWWFVVTPDGDAGPH